ncbi:MAG TPA: MarR family winged helix-turn-helix transcriptional regulator [Candidatus Lokiarchaeia archaeon]|nr:MarR family winged helix-turn-helix transcriptional regulator [Candidatus Lokiarchaeia archaeon]
MPSKKSTSSKSAKKSAAKSSTRKAAKAGSKTSSARKIGKATSGKSNTRKAKALDEEDVPAEPVPQDGYLDADEMVIIPMDALEPEEKEMFSVLCEQKEILQSDLSNYLTIDSRKASRLVINMEEKKYIQRERVLNNGRWTYILRVNQELPKVEVKGKKTWETLENCPCFACPDLDACNVGQNKNNPQFCLHLTRWMNCCMTNVPFEHMFQKIEEGLRKD